MEKTIFVCIGWTGTPALHRYLWRNQRALKKRGIFYPVSRKTEGEGNLHDLRELIGGMLSTGCHTGIISADNLARDCGTAGVRDIIPGSFAVKLVYYAMRQDELAESWYHHSVESPGSRYDGILDDNLVNSLTGMLDHAAVILPWADTFGAENILLRCCENGQMNGGIVRDFVRVIGLEPDKSLRIPDATPENNLSAHQTEFLRQCNISLKDKPEVHRFLLSEFRRSRFRAKQHRQYLLSPGKRREILERFANSNRDIARQYLHRDDGCLFYEPWPAPDEPWEPFNGLTVEELTPILVELIYEQQDRWERPGQPLGILCSMASNILKKMEAVGPSEDRRTAPQQQPGRQGSVPAGIPGRAVMVQPVSQRSRPVSELVPMVAETVYRRNQRLQEIQPLGTILLMVNRFLARTVHLLPPQKQERIYRRFVGEAFWNE